MALCSDETVVTLVMVTAGPLGRPLRLPVTSRSQSPATAVCVPGVGYLRKPSVVTQSSCCIGKCVAHPLCLCS